MTSRPELASKTKERLPQWQPPSINLRRPGARTLVRRSLGVGGPPSKRCALISLFGRLLAAGLLRFVFVVFLDRLHRGRHRGADEAVPVVARPIVGLFAGDVGLVDDGRHMALPEIVGFLGRFEIRP